MAFSPPLILASVDGMRPVFLIVMGLTLLLVAWRLTRRHSGWSSRILMAGALLLAFGYGLVLPLYDAGVLTPLSHLAFRPEADAGVALGWHMAKLCAMNGGWLFFGLGIALQAGVFESDGRVSLNTEPAHS